jgi:hypothetical protein
LFQTGHCQFEKSKQQFHLGKPVEEPFAEDFNRTISFLEKFQSATAKTKDRKNLLVKQYDETMVRFMHHLFTKMVMFMSTLCFRRVLIFIRINLFHAQKVLSLRILRSHLKVRTSQATSTLFSIVFSHHRRRARQGGHQNRFMACATPSGQRT